MSRTYLRGEIYYADLDPVVGSEQMGTRPVLILQNNVGNHFARTVIVAPITSRIHTKSKIPTHSYIGTIGRMKYPSVVMLEQLRTLDKRRIGYYIGKLPEEKMQDVIQQIVGRHNRVVNLSNPIVDTRLADGSRVNIVLAPVSLDGSTITIRKFPEKPLDMQTLIQKGALPEDAAEFLKMLVRAKYNLLISGGTSSGKTTFLNALSQYIPEDERVITIEDSAELQIQGIKNLVRLETRNANMEGVQPVTIRDLIRTALRMRPDRILVGECRGAEAFDMLQALNTGHDGGLSTAHGNSSRDILSRLEMMVLMGMELPIAAIRQQIASGIDLIVHLGRLPDKSRRVLEITEVCGVKDGQIQISPIYELEGIGGSWKWKHCGILKNRKKLEMAGLTREKGEIEDGLSRVSSEPEGGL